MTDTVETPATQNLTIVAHDDKAKSVLDRILAALELAELVEPLIINIIHPSGFNQIQLPAKKSA